MMSKKDDRIEHLEALLKAKDGTIEILQKGNEYLAACLNIYEQYRSDVSDAHVQVEIDLAEAKAKYSEPSIAGAGANPWGGRFTPNEMLRVCDC